MLVVSRCNTTGKAAGGAVSLLGMGGVSLEGVRRRSFKSHSRGGSVAVAMELGGGIFVLPQRNVIGQSLKRRIILICDWLPVETSIN